MLGQCTELAMVTRKTFTTTGMYQRSARLETRFIPRQWGHKMIVLLLNTGKKYEIDEKLFPCTDWDKAEWRYPNPVPEWRESHAIACNVTITGRTIVHAKGGLWKRGKLTWVGDGEPDTFSPCLVACDCIGELL